MVKSGPFLFVLERTATLAPKSRRLCVLQLFVFPPSEGEVEEWWGSDCESGAFPREADEMITENLRWDEEQRAQRGGVSDPTSHS